MASTGTAQPHEWDGQGNQADWLADNCTCTSCLSTSPDFNGPRVLTAVVPWPDESLVGLVTRTSARNHLDRLRSILAVAGSALHTRFNLAVRDDLDFVQLAFAARLPFHEIEARRYRPVSAAGDRLVVDFYDAAVPACDLELRYSRVTPSWLKAGYHSALGHHALVTHCPKTGEILFDHCPRCNLRLT